MPYVLGDDFGRATALFPAPAPYGEDVKFDPIYQDLRAEVQKLTANSATDGGTDWKSVKLWSLTILGEKSKDLTVACYLTLALFYLDGYGGLADGLALLGKLIREDWDGMFPVSARPRTRAVALEWLVSRLAPFVEQRPPTAEEGAILAEVRNQIPAFQEAVKLRLFHEAPGFSELSAALSGHAALMPAAPPAPAEAATTAQGAAAPAAAPPPPAQAAAAPVVIAAGTPAEEIADRIRQLVPPLRQAEPLSPLPYRLYRALKWDGIVAPPPTDPASPNPGTTRIPPPRREQRDSLERLHGAGAWAELLTASEGAFQDGVGTFWLDLHRYSAAALTGLDPVGGKRAAKAIEREVAEFLGRLPTLATLHFADRNLPAPAGKPNEKAVERTPFASEATRQWIENEVLARPEAEGGGMPFLMTSAPAATEPTIPPEDAQKAQDLLGKGQLAAGFALLQGAIHKAGQPQERFRTRLAAARLCLQANQAAWARGLLEELATESETFRFEDWDPATAVELYQLLAVCTARPAKKGGPADPEVARVRLEELRRKILRLDLTAAAALEEALRR